MQSRTTVTLALVVLALLGLAAAVSSGEVDGQRECIASSEAGGRLQPRHLHHIGHHQPPGSARAASLVQWPQAAFLPNRALSSTLAWSGGPAAASFASTGASLSASLSGTGRRLAQACASSPYSWSPNRMGNNTHLAVLYATPVYAISVSIHENWRSGFVKKVQLVDMQLVATTVWEGTDTTTCGGWLNITFAATAVAIKAVNVSTAGDGSQEVDQVLMSGIPVAAPAPPAPASPGLAPYPAPYEQYTQWPAITSSSCSDPLHPARNLQQAPGVTQCGGSNRAWRPCATPPAFHTITVTYPAPVYAQRVDVLETAVAGIVSKVELRDAQGGFQAVWQDLDLTPCNGWLNASFPLRPYLTSQVRVTVAQYIGIEELSGVALTGWGIPPYRSPVPSPPPAAPPSTAPATFQQITATYISLHINGTCDALSPMDATKQAWITSLVKDSLAKTDPTYSGVITVSSIIADTDAAGNCLITAILRGNTDLQLFNAAVTAPSLLSGMQAYFPGAELTVAGGWEEQLSGWLDGDNIPPKIILLPPGNITLSMYQSYQEPGAFAVDNVDTTVRVVINMPVINTKVATVTPYAIAYDAADFQGNKAATVYRYVHVVSPCVAPEFYCPELMTCSVLQECSIILSPFSKSVQSKTEAGQPDIVPPVITLKGITSNMTTVSGVEGYATYVQQGKEYVDAGAAATDPEDGDISSSILVQGVASVITDQPTADKPYLVTYDVQDMSGNWATTQRRWVHVVCAASEKVCVLDEGLFCSVGQVCAAPPYTTDSAGLLSSISVPSIRLVGPSVVTIVKGTIYNACPAGLSPAYNCDRGVVALDVSGKSLAANVTACLDKALPNTQTAFRVVGLRNCLLNTTRPGRYSITFSVSNSVGVSATAVRTVVVQESCSHGETPCSDGTCSGGGTCLATVANVPKEASTNSVPNITLAVPSSYQGEVVYVKQGTAYLPCKDMASGSVLGPGQPCEPGATAWDAEDGNLTASVLACPPDSCLSTGCAGHEFRLKGLRGCGIDTSAAVGTTYQLQFMVFDNWSPMASAITNRTVVVISPCPSDEVLCDGSCVKVDCTIQRQLKQAQLSATGPSIILLPWHQDSAAGKNMSVRFFAGIDTSHSLLPCMSLEAASNCGAVARDRKGNDVSQNITVEDVHYCANQQCWSCYPDLLASGSCPPGTYLLRYSVADVYGSKSQLFLTITIDALLEATLQLSCRVQDDVQGAQVAATNMPQNATASTRFAEAYLPYFTIPIPSLHLVNVMHSSIRQVTAAATVQVVLDVTMYIQVNGSYFTNSSHGGVHVQRRLHSSGAVNQAGATLSIGLPERQGGGSARKLTQSSSSCVAEVPASYQLTGLPMYSAFRELINISSTLPTCLVLVGSQEAHSLANAFAGLAALQFLQNLVVRNQSEAAVDVDSMLTLLSTDGGSYSPTLLFQARQYMSLYPDKLRAMAALMGSTTTKTTSDYVEDLYPVHPTYSMYMSHIGTIKDLDYKDDLACFRNRSSSIRFRFNFTHSWSSGHSTSTNATRRLQGMAATGQSLTSPADTISDASATAAARLEMVLLAKKYKSSLDVGDPSLVHYLFKKSRVIGGLLMHMVHSQTKQDMSTALVLCHHLDGTNRLCNNFLPATQTFNTPANKTADAGFGQDPAFFTLSPMFDPVTASNPQEWYNISSDVGNAVPYGFHHQAIPGLPDGYPVWLGNEMRAQYAPRVLQYLKDGAYLSAPDTTMLTLSMATMNRDLGVIFFWKGLFDWRTDGSIAFKLSFQGLPAVDWERITGAFKLLYADILLVVLVAGYWVFTAFSVMRYCVRWLLDIIRHGHSAQLSRYNKALTPFWAAYEIILCALMMSSVLVKYIYSFIISPHLSIPHRYPVYDNPGVFKTTRPMLLKRIPVDWPSYYPLLDTTNSNFARIPLAVGA